MGKQDSGGFGLVISGLVLFFIGLLIGYWISVAPTGKSMLPAHEAAIGGGTFLMAVGLASRRFVKRRMTLTSFGLVTSNYILVFGLFGLNLPMAPLKTVSNVAVILGCAEMTIATLAAIVVFLMNRAAGPGDMPVTQGRP